MAWELLHSSKGTPGLWMVTQGQPWLEEALMKPQGCSKSCAGFTADSFVTLIRDCGFQELEQKAARISFAFLGWACTVLTNYLSVLHNFIQCLHLHAVI